MSSTGHDPGLAGDRDALPGRVSVIITSCNGERWIRSAVDSALAQSYRNRELIIVDDASTDGSPRILAEYARLPDVTLVRHERNRGIPATKNHALRHAAGEFVAFLEQDDEWLEDKLAKQVAVLERDREVGLVHADVIIVDDAGREVRRRSVGSVPADSRRRAVETVFLGTPVHSMSSMAMPRRCLRELGGFDESLYGADDWDLCLRLAGRYKIAFIDEPQLRRRIHAESASSAGAGRIHADCLEVIAKAVERYPFLAALEGRRRAMTLTSWAVQAAYGGRFRQARRAAAAAIRSAPLLPKPYLAMVLALSGRAGAPGIRYWRRHARMREI